MAYLTSAGLAVGAAALGFRGRSHPGAALFVLACLAIPYIELRSPEMPFSGATVGAWLTGALFAAGGLLPVREALVAVVAIALAGSALLWGRFHLTGDGALASIALLNLWAILAAVWSGLNQRARTMLAQRKRQMEAELDERRLAQAALAEREAQLEGLLDVAFDGWLIHQDLKTVDVSDALARRLGYTRDELVGSSFLDRIAPEQHAAVRTRVAGGTEELYEAIMVRKDGSHVSVEVAAHPTRWGGRPARLIAVRNLAHALQATTLLRLAAEVTSTKVGLDYLEALVAALAEALGARAAFVARPAPDAPGTIETLALWVDGRLRPNIRYPAAGTPCEPVATAGQLLIATGAGARYPHQPWLANAPIEGYLAISISAPGGQRLGHIGIVHTAALPVDVATVSALKIFAARTATELQRQEAEMRLRRSEEQYRDLVDNIHEWICTHDDEGRLLSVNPAVVRGMGYTRDEDMIGRSLAEFLTPRARDAFPQYLQRIREAGQAIGLMHVVTRTGDERVLEYDNSVGTDSTGARVVRGVSRDVTDRIRAERRVRRLNLDLEERVAARTEELRRSQELFETLARVSPVGIYRTDAEGRCTYVNARWCSITGVALDAALGTTWTWAVHPDDRDRVFHRWRTATQQGEEFRMEFRFQCPDGPATWVYSQALAERDPAGGVTGYVGAVIDITERHQYEERMRVLLDGAPDAIVVANGRGEIVQVNTEAERLFAGSRDALVGRSIDALVPARIRHIHPDFRAAFATDPSPRHMGTATEVTAVALDGREFEVDVRLSPVVINGEAHVVAGIRDVSGRKRTERALLVSDAAIATSNTAMAFVALDGRVSYANQAFVELWGYPSVERVVWRPFALFWAHVDRWRAAVDAVEREGRFVGELIARRYDGSDMTLACSANTVVDNDGGRICMMGTFVDVSALRLHESRLAQAQRIAHLGNWDYDVDRNILWWSEEAHRIFGVDSAAFGGRFESFLERVHPDDVPAVKTAIADALSGRRSYSIDHRVVRADGEIRYVHEEADTWTDAGRARRMVGTMQDITERHRTEQALRESEERFRQAQKMEAIGRLAGGVAHDFNNLLTVITGYTEALLDEMHEADPRWHKASEVLKASKRAASLTRQLLAFSRRQVLQPRMVDLNGVVQEVRRMLARLIGEDVRLEVSSAPDLWPVLADPTQLEQVLMNLAVNARDAMPRGGRLTIATRNVRLDKPRQIRDVAVPEGSYVLLEVADTGVGMDDATRARAFEPFFTTKGPGKGTGLGLATVYGIVKQSGGFIDVETAPDRGTLFRLYFGRTDEASEPAPGSVDLDAVVNAPAGVTVLLVEDEEGVRQLTRMHLEQAGYGVLEAAASKVALAIAEAHAGAIDLLLTDVVMPEMDGPELSRCIAVLRPTTKVLFMSGYTEDEVLLRGVAAQKANLVMKPFSRDVLLTAVARVLD